MTLTIRSPEKFATMPNAVLIDLDNTLYHYDPAHSAALEQARVKAERILGMGARDFDALYDQSRKILKAQLGPTAASHNRLLYFQRAIELAGLKTQVLAALDLEQTYWRSFLTNARLFEGVLEFFDDMRLLGIPIVIITDLTAQIQFRKLVYFGLDHYIDYVVTSEETGEDKPAKAGFEIAIAKIGATHGCVWMIGDDPVADISGAAALANPVSVQKLHDGVKKSEPPADASFDNFLELRGMLARFNVEQKRD
jgi:putative hydrolase of the HAD superfamily